MQTIGKAVTKSGNVGRPLPDVFKSLGNRKINFRRGGVAMIAGPPGSFKSTFALNLCCEWAQRDGLTGLYISADSDAFTVGKRCAGILTGEPTWRIEKRLRTGDYSADLAKIRDIHWEFCALDMEQIGQRIKAHHVMYGDFPDFIVIDNLMNMVDNPDDWGQQLRMTRDLDELSRATGSHIMLLHHTHEERPGKGEDGEPCPQGAWSIMGKVAQFPRLVLTLMADPRGILMVAPVKNTNGPSDRSGRTYESFNIETATCQVSEIAIT